MNSLVGKPSTFEVSSGDEGFTKGLWLHPLDAGGALPASRHDPLGAGEGGSDAPAEVATILIDSEGLGAPGGSKVYDTKMVALTAMLSSVVFYNNMRKVNKMDVEFLGDVVLFDEIFRSMTQEPLLASEIVWLVQSYSSNDACADYPARFLRKLAAGTQDDDLLMHDRVIDYVLTRSRDERIFCLPYPKTEPYTPEAELYALGYHELDHGYTAQIDTVRQFVAGVPPKAGLQAESMTGAELAEVIERIVPALNDIETAAKALVSMRAEAARSNSTRLASTELDAALQLLDDCSKAPSSLSHFTQDSQRVVDDADVVAGAHADVDALERHARAVLVVQVRLQVGDRVRRQHDAALHLVPAREDDVAVGRRELARARDGHDLVVRVGDGAVAVRE